MTTKLRLYNRACRILGQTRLASLTEDIEIRHNLDEVYDDGFIDNVLSQGSWNFAIRTIENAYNPSIDPDFGYQRVHDKPSDWINTVQISTDEYFTHPLLDYLDEVDKWYTSHDTIYVRYVSNDASYGGTLANWPEAFAEFAAYYLAKEIVRTVTDSDKLVKEVKGDFKTARTEARSQDAMNQPTEFPPDGYWVRSRRGGSRRDRGNRGALTGS